MFVRLGGQDSRTTRKSAAGPAPREEGPGGQGRPRAAKGGQGRARAGKGRAGTLGAGRVDKGRRAGDQRERQGRLRFPAPPCPALPCHALPCPALRCPAPHRTHSSCRCQTQPADLAALQVSTMYERPSIMPLLGQTSQENSGKVPKVHRRKLLWPLLGQGGHSLSVFTFPDFSLTSLSLSLTFYASSKSS